MAQAPADIAPLEVVDLDGGIERRMGLAPEKAALINEGRRHIAGPTGCGLCGIDSIEQALRPAAVVTGGRSLAPPQIITPQAPGAPVQAVQNQTRPGRAPAVWAPAPGPLPVRGGGGRPHTL